MVSTELNDSKHIFNFFSFSLLFSLDVLLKFANIENLPLFFMRTNPVICP